MSLGHISFNIVVRKTNYCWIHARRILFPPTHGNRRNHKRRASCGYVPIGECSKQAKNDHRVGTKHDVQRKALARSLLYKQFILSQTLSNTLKSCWCYSCSSTLALARTNGATISLTKAMLNISNGHNLFHIALLLFHGSLLSALVRKARWVVIRSKAYIFGRYSLDQIGRRPF